MSYRFTVFSSTYNRAHTLPYVHESLKHQTFQDFEWLIVDDGSTDETQELIKVWQKRKNFPYSLFLAREIEKNLLLINGYRRPRGWYF
jgi:glycosyltransferase involved in cell wall biosynthesis